MTKKSAPAIEPNECRACRHFRFSDNASAMTGPSNWRSGFAVLTFRDGRLLWPELVARVDEEHVQFRGEVIEV